MGVCNLLRSLTIILLLNFICNKAISDNGFTEYINTGPTFKSITIDNLNNKLICTYTSGVIKFDGLTSTYYNTANSSISSNLVRNVVVDVNNTYWFATDKGLCKFDGNNWFTYDTINSNILSNNLLSLYFKDNNLYIGTDKGFSIFNNGIFINYSNLNGFISDSVNCFTSDFNNNIWIGTNQGLTKLNNTGGFTFFNQMNSGLKNNIVLSLYFDGINLWIGSKSYCLHRLEIAVNEIKNIADIFDTPIVFSESPPIKSINIGPRGGVSFGMIEGRFYEIFQNKIYVYYKTTNASFNQNLRELAFAADFQNELIWITGLTNRLISFKLNEYNGYAISNTYENYKALDINNVSAAVTNRGDMFWDIDVQKANYKIPKNENKTAVFMNSLWLAGLDQNNNLHLSAQTYRQNGIDFWPGTIDTINGATDTLTVIKYDKVWKINWFDVEQFKYNFSIGNVQNGSWFPSNDIITWPAIGENNYSRKLAPFVDVNQNGTYDPIHDGDYPDIKGDQMIFWIFNDCLGPHTESGGVPLRVEVQASAYAFSCPDFNNVDSAINYTTFYNYKIFNRSGLNYDSCYIGNFTDFDLGVHNNDAICSNPNLDLVFCYNYDNVDGTGNNETYGVNPPVIGNVLLKTPTGKMNVSIAYSNDQNSINGNPDNQNHYYNYLKGLWKDGSSLTYGGNGIGGNISTNFIFSGIYQDTIPWYSTNGSDVRSLQSSGPFSFPANSSIDYDFAIVYARDTVGNDSPQLFQQLFDNAARAKSWFDNNTFPSCVGPNKIKAIGTELNHLEVFPNPANEIINFKSTNKKPVLSYTIYNAMGKAIVSNTNVNTNEIYIAHFAKGIYFLQLKFVDGKSSTQKFIKN